MEWEETEVTDEEIFTEDDIETLLISHMLRYSDHHKDFRRDFVDDIYDFFEKNGYVTGKQLKILFEMFYKNGVDLWLEGREEK